MQVCPTLLSIRETQIRSAVRYHLQLVRMAIVKKSTINKRQSECGGEPSYTVGGNVS